MVQGKGQRMSKLSLRCIQKYFVAPGKLHDVHFEIQNEANETDKRRPEASSPCDNLPQDNLQHY
jgi:hypothetical protein